MPLYDYDCADCGTRFEVIHGVHADPPTSCPVCGGGPIKKAFTAPAVHFKGSGWAKKERRASAAPSSNAKAAETVSGNDVGSGEGASAGSGTGDTASSGSDAASKAASTTSTTSAATTTASSKD